MVQELERLRKLLDATPPDQLRRDTSVGVSGSDDAYNGALNVAEVRTATQHSDPVFRLL